MEKDNCQSERGELASAVAIEQCRVAKRLLEQGPTRENEERAASLYLAAAEAGLSSAQYNLADMYLRGAGLPKDINESIRWFEKAAAQDDFDALFNLGLIFSSSEAVEQNLEQAFAYFEKAAQGGLARAQYELGCAYQTGRGVPISLELAEIWFAQAAAQGIGRANQQLIELTRTTPKVRIIRHNRRV